MANKTGVPQYPEPLTGGAGLTSAIPGPAYDCGGISSIIFEIYGTFVGTIIFQGTIDDGLSSTTSGLNYPGEPNWYQINAVNLNTGNTEDSATAPGIWLITYPLSQFRLDVTGYTSGTIYGVARGATTVSSNPFASGGGGGSTNVNVVSIAGSPTFSYGHTVSVSTSATQLTSGQTKFAYIYNNDLSNTVYLGDSTVVVGSTAVAHGGIALQPGGSLQIPTQGFTGNWYGIVASGTAVVAAWGA